MRSRCRSLLFAVLALLAPALLTPLAAGQLSVDPVSRNVVVTAGKSTKITIDAGDCSPTWTAVSSNQGVAEVSPSEAGAGSKRSFSVKTSGQGQASITISVVGAGPDCSNDYDVVVTITAVMDVKAVSKFFGKGLKSTLKELKGQSKQIPKDYQSTLKGILGALKDETLGNEGPGGGLTHAQMADLAVTQGEDALSDAFDQIFNEYADAVLGMKSAGESTALLYGFGLYLDQLPPGFFEGGCGEWDAATKAGWELFVSTVEKLNALSKKFDEDVQKEVAGEAALTVVATALEIPEFTTGGVSIDGNLKGGEFGAGDKGLTQKRPKATNYVDDEGSNQHGRIRAKGKADPAGGNLTVTYERLDSNGDPVGMNEGDFVEEAGVTINSNCKWRNTSQGLSTTPNLRPGKWRVTVSQGMGDNEVTKVREVTVPVPKS